MRTDEPIRLASAVVERIVTIPLSAKASVYFHRRAAPLICWP
jgi:hypothetical protein